MSGPLRILVSGSRAWQDREAIRRALVDVLTTHNTAGRPVLVHGGARGADTIADQLWRALDRGRPGVLEPEPEVHRADWERYGPSAGHRRNAEMIAAGADVVLAFPIEASPGTRGCIAAAEKAGIPVRVIEGAMP